MKLQKYTWPLLIILIFPTVIVGDIYKWTDEEGKIHYGKKPTTGSSIEEIKIKDKPVYDEELKQRNEEQKKILDVFEEERKERKEQIEEKNKYDVNEKNDVKAYAKN